MKGVNQEIAHKSTHHINVSMSEVDELDNPINHGIAESEQSIDTPQNQTINKLLEHGHHTF